MTGDERPNIALVVLDTLRKDAFDERFDWLPGKRFERAYSPSHWTVPAHAALFGGAYASELGVYAGSQGLDCPEPVLAERLRDAGYTTRAFSSNVNVSKPFGFHRGFAEFEGSWRLQALDENVYDWDQFVVETRGMGPHRYALGLWDCLTGDCDTLPSLKRGALLKLRDLGWGERTRDDGATEAVEYVKTTEFGDGEFLFVNLMEAHTPYAPPPEYRTVEPPELNGLEATLGEPTADPDHLRQAYDDAVRYLSEMYERLFSELRREFDYVITLSDHGEVLGEHGAWEHLCGVYPELAHVPLVVSGDGLDGTAAETVSLLDVHRTVLDLADAGGDSRGRNLLDGVESGEFLTEYHGLTDRHRLALSKAGFDPRPLDVDLRGFAAPPTYYGWETFDGFGGFDQRGDAATSDPRARMAALVDGLDERRATDDVEVSESVRAQLEELGYA